jgi:GNAT superfamily N-acetyltransferase
MRTLIEGLLRIRPGTIDDIEDISRVYEEAWKATYQGVAPEPFVKGMTAGAAAQIFQDSLQPGPAGEFKYFFYVAQSPSGRLVGFCDGGKERSHPENGVGELYAIYILPEFQKKGIGKLLFEEAVESLLLAGMKSMMVWVLSESPFRKFYEGLGGKLDPGVKTLEAGGHKIDLVSYRWPDLSHH